MKRLFATLLVAILFVTSFALVASAATVVAPGDSATLTVTVSNATGFNYFTAKVTVDPNLTVTSAAGAHINQVAGNTVYFLWDNTENVTSKSMTINVTVSGTAGPGVYGASVAAEGATVIVPGEEGAAGTVEYTSVSAACSAVEIVAPECDHVWSDWTVTKEATCTEEGEKTRTCSLCGEVETAKIPMIPHDFVGWCKDEGKHWHECSMCGQIFDEAAHTWGSWKTIKPATDTEDGTKVRLCTVCGEDNFGTIPAGMDDVPETGDITPRVNVGFVAAVVLSMFCVVAYVTKRRIVK